MQVRFGLKVKRVARVASLVRLERLERSPFDGDVAHDALVHAHVVPELIDHLRLDVERHLHHLSLFDADKTDETTDNGVRSFISTGEKRALRKKATRFIAA